MADGLRSLETSISSGETCAGVSLVINAKRAKFLFEIGCCL